MRSYPSYSVPGVYVVLALFVDQTAARGADRNETEGTEGSLQRRASRGRLTRVQG
jgi:hypothetical protein